MIHLADFIFEMAMAGVFLYFLVKAGRRIEARFASYDKEIADLKSQLAKIQR